jgi:hypothetical protein
MLSTTPWCSHQTGAQPTLQEAAVKKLLLLVAAGAGAFAVWRKMEADKAEQDLWAEATDDVS